MVFVSFQSFPNCRRIIAKLIKPKPFSPPGGSRVEENIPARAFMVEESSELEIGSVAEYQTVDSIMLAVGSVCKQDAGNEKKTSKDSHSY